MSTLYAFSLCCYGFEFCRNESKKGQCSRDNVCVMVLERSKAVVEEPIRFLDCNHCRQLQQRSLTL
jgi:hypothetical protein